MKLFMNHLLGCYLIMVFRLLCRPCGIYDYLELELYTFFRAIVIEWDTKHVQREYMNGRSGGPN